MSSEYCFDEVEQQMHDDLRDRETGQLDVRRTHHVWCSYFTTCPEKCKMCDRLYKEYPIEGLTPDELQQKYFPNVIKR